MSFLLNVKRLLLTLIEKYHPFTIKYFKVLVVIIMTLLLGAVLIMGWMSSSKVKEIVTEDFNEQQLLVARHVATQIENSIDILKRELLLLSLSPSIQYFEIPSLKDRMETAYSRIAHMGTLEIRFIENSTKKVHHVIENHKCATGDIYPEDLDYLEWARKEENRGDIFLTPLTTVSYNGQSEKPIMKMISPVWQVSTDEAYPVPLNEFSGVLVFVIDLSHLTGNITKDIRSGKTGYCWIIDGNGIFLYHPEKDFVGKNAFEVRKGKNPAISFEKINEIQRDKMLKGEEGTSWYISGWHRGIEGEIRKLIAFTPFKLDEKIQNRIWSIAVVAPVSEVKGTIHSIHVRQFYLQAIIIFVILFGGLFINFMILTWSNILEQEVAKKTIELKKSEQRYKSLVENAEDIIFTVDYKGNFLSINKYGIRFFNRKVEEIVGNNLSEILSWPNADMLLLMIQKVFDTKESKQITHMFIIGDREYWFNTNLRRLYDEQGNIYAVLGISRDITERKHMEEYSYYTEKLASMGTLAAGVAHEINNPLGIILGFTDLMLEKATPDSAEYDMLKTIEKQGLNAKRVVENLLDFARHKEHKEEFIDINENIGTVLAVMGNTLLLKKISVNQNLQEDLPSVKADARELQQVFFNVINNSIYAMEGGGILTITTRSFDNNEKIEIRISDTGHGIKKEHRIRIFDPLFTTKEVDKGTGLGLSVSYGIVTKHEGSISFETKTKEESAETGTTFIIIFPAVKKSRVENKGGENGRKDIDSR